MTSSFSKINLSQNCKRFTSTESINPNAFKGHWGAFRIMKHFTYLASRS